MVGGAHVKLCTIGLKKFLPKPAHKDGIPVRNEAFGETVEFADNRDKEFGYVICGETCWKHTKMCTL